MAKGYMCHGCYEVFPRKLRGDLCPKCYRERAHGTQYR